MTSQYDIEVELDPLAPLNSEAYGRPHLERNSRLTRSLASDSTGTPSSSFHRGQPIRMSAMERERRRASLDRREKQLNEWTKECSQFMDAMLESSRELKEKEAENEALRCENDQLRGRLHDLQLELDEYKLLNREQQDQLSFFRERTALVRQEADKFKVENMVLHSGNFSLEAHAQLIEEQKQLRQDMQSMVRKSRETQAIIDQLQADNNALTSRLKAQKAAEEDTGDPRTKRELLRVIRRAKEEKCKWENYAEHLLRQIVTTAPHVLEIRLRPDVEHCCAEEARWEAFSLSLVQTVMERHPELLESVRTPTETDHEKLAHSKRSKVVSVV